MAPATSGSADVLSDHAAAATEHPGPRQPADVQKEAPGASWPSFPGPSQQLQTVIIDNECEPEMEQPLPEAEAVSAPQGSNDPAFAEQSTSATAKSTAAAPHLASAALQSASAAPQEGSPRASKVLGRSDSNPAPKPIPKSDSRSTLLSKAFLWSPVSSAPIQRRLNRAGSNVSRISTYSSVGSAGSAGSAMRWAAGKLGATSARVPKQWGPRGPASVLARKPQEPVQGGRMPGAREAEESIPPTLTEPSQPQAQTLSKRFSQASSQGSINSLDDGDPQAQTLSKRFGQASSQGSINSLDDGDPQSRARNHWAKVRVNTRDLHALNGKSAEIKALTNSLNKAAELGAMVAADNEVLTAGHSPKSRGLRRSSSSASLRSKASSVSRASSAESVASSTQQLSPREDEPDTVRKNSSGKLKRSVSTVSAQSLESAMSHKSGRSVRSGRSRLSGSLKAVVEAPSSSESTAANLAKVADLERELETVVDGSGHGSRDADGDEQRSPSSLMSKSALRVFLWAHRGNGAQKSSRLQSRCSELAWLALKISAVALPSAALCADILLDGEQLGELLARGCIASTILVSLLLCLLVSRQQARPMWQSEHSYGSEQFSLDINGNVDELDTNSILQQQTEILFTAASQLQEVEKDLQLWDSLRQEQESLLRGFNKIVTQEVSLNRGQPRVSVIVVESCESVRQEYCDLCQQLHYRCQAFPSLDAARGSLDTDATFSNCNRSQASQGGILKDRPRLKRDWRSRVFFQNAGIDESELWARVVLVGANSLPEQLPEEQFLADSNAFVAVSGEVWELEAMAKQLFSVTFKEAREQLRQRGIGECLRRPITKDALGAVAMEAIYRMREEFLLLESIGRGTWGNVYRVKRLRDGAVLAMKMVNPKTLSRNVREAMEREVQLVRALKWPTCLFLLDAWVSGKVQCMLFPLLDGGDLLKETRKVATGDGTPPNWASRVLDWYVQTVHGLTYLHWLGVVHVDIKPANLLLANDRRALMVSDFGSAMLLPGKGPHPSRQNFVRKPLSTPAYASPETLFEDMAFAVSDCWSLGASFYEVLTLQSLMPAHQGEPKVLLESLNFDFQETGTAPDPKNLAPAAVTSLRKIVQRHALEGPAAEEFAAEILELLRRDHQQRPSTAALAVRTKTSARLQVVLEEECSFDQTAVLEHFKEFAHMCVESEMASSIDPPPELLAKTPSLRGEIKEQRGPLRRSFSTSFLERQTS